MHGTQLTALCALLTTSALQVGAAGPADWNQRVRTATQGSTVRLDGLPQPLRDWPRVAVEISPAPGPQFLFSDKPEYFPRNGISLQEQVKPGQVRLYVYHVPQPDDGPKTISAAISNLGRAPLHLRMLRRGFPRPTGDYPRIAREALKSFLLGEAAPRQGVVAPEEIVPLDLEMDHATALKDQLVHGFFEFEIDQPARITVFQRDPAEPTAAAVTRLPALPGSRPEGSGAGRGLFAGCNYDVTNRTGSLPDTVNGPLQLILADGKGDPWIRGYDSLDGKEARNVGNYGALYRVRLKVESSDGRGWALLMNRLEVNNQYCGGMAAAVQVSEGAWPGGVVVVPSDRPVLAGRGEAALIQKFPPPESGATMTIEITYSPPGAACLPTPILLVPYVP